MRVAEIPDHVRLEDRGYKSACEVWTGATAGGRAGDRCAYARIDGRSRRVLRARWEALIGPLPSHTDLDHLCRVRLCVRLDHAEPVTRAVNLRRGRTTKLTESIVRLVRSRVGGGEMQKNVAADLRIPRSTVTNIIARRVWRDV